MIKGRISNIYSDCCLKKACTKKYRGGCFTVKGATEKYQIVVN